jgi:hypothetical protein
MFNETHLQPDAFSEKQSYNKGGVIEFQGYIHIYKPSHPYANGKYMRLHRLVVEYMLGRYLLPHEQVHHIDGNKKNNHFSNLQIVSLAEHRRIHNILDKKGVKKYNLEQVELLYNAGYSMREIAQELEMGKSTVGSYIKELGISRPRLQNRCPVTNQFIKHGHKPKTMKRDKATGRFLGG